MFPRAYAHQNFNHLNHQIPRHQIQEVGMDSRDLLLAQYLIWVLLYFGQGQPCTNLLNASVIGLQLIFRHSVFKYSSLYFCKLY
jgi:hypothetical protein